MAQPHNTQESFDEDFLDDVMEVLIEQPENALNCISSNIAATEARMRFSAMLPMGGFAIASSSERIPCSNSSYIGKMSFRHV